MMLATTAPEAVSESADEQKSEGEIKDGVHGVPRLRVKITTLKPQSKLNSSQLKIDKANSDVILVIIRLYLNNIISKLV